MATSVTSYIHTSGGTRVRTAETLSRSLPFRPQSLTVYCRFVDVVDPAPSRDIALFQNSGSVPSFYAYVEAGGAAYGAYYFYNGVGQNVNPTVARSGATGKPVELLLTLTPSGAAQISVAIAGGSVATGSATAAHPFPSAWGTNLFYLTETSVLVALRDLLIVRGSHSMATMRARLGQT